MFIPLPQRHKIPLLIAIFVFFAFLVFTSHGDFLFASLGIVGAVLAIVALDFEYVLHFKIIDPANPLGQEFMGLIKSAKFLSAARFLNENEYRFGEMSIRSALFQGLMTIFGLYFITASLNPFIQCFALSMLLNLLYIQIMEFNKTNTLKRWFWIYNGELSREGYIGYMILMAFCAFIQFYFV